MCGDRRVQHGLGFSPLGGRVDPAVLDVWRARRIEAAVFVSCDRSVRASGAFAQAPFLNLRPTTAELHLPEYSVCAHVLYVRLATLSMQVRSEKPILEPAEG